ncbi:DUF881 domain-containing protein [Nocardioides aurantiacus]|uniref:Uncharacterized protein YlxW (UPF0749 family) n=1 Tax=Nocardioides aurantiacus TaxID=86796 RepID=A0A3N2CZP1_9ACTN|nr:DUF881 domain-containing protein [Nocardioides aurantiacus]ROR92953.1 uncharacterized protein YlxW (UPF0749 family) [Nocardioides aurantiacus]
MPSRHRRRPRATQVPPWRLAAVGGFVVAGTLFVTSSLNADGLDLRSSSVTDLDTVVRQERDRTDQLQQRVADLTDEVDTLGRSVGDAEVRELQAQVRELAAPAGFEAVRGPALTVTLEDAPAEVIAQATEKGEVGAEELVVHQQDIQAVVNALWIGGAEAMTLQGQRVISTTGIKCVGNTVVLHGVPYAPPYVITAVGGVTEMRRALDTSERIADYRDYAVAYDLGFAVRTDPEVTLPAYDGASELRHATAVRGESDRAVRERP